MQPPRRKPRVNHVRTGCLTCKYVLDTALSAGTTPPLPLLTVSRRRRVKCPEEHPQCSRCTRGGFVCAGYAIPKPWIFESSTEVQKKTDEEGSEPSNDSPHLDPGSQTPPDSQLTHTFSNMSLSSPLQLGNSDPFNAYAIPIGPYEVYLSQVYQQLTFPQLYNLKQPKWRQFVANEIASTHHTCLQDEAAAYSLFARNSALEHVIIRRSNPAVSTPLLNYMTRTQAALHRRLALMDGSETPQTVYTITWTTCFLASAEMIVKSSTTDYHFRALGKLIVRYAELMGENMEIGSILILVYVVLMRASTTLTVPVLDMADWFPRVCQDTWYEAEALWPMRVNSSPGIAVHREIKDKVIREIMTSQRQGPNFSPDLIETCHDTEKARLLANTMRSQELYQNGQMLNVATDALKQLGAADLTLESLQDESARAYMAISTIVWLRLTSATTFFGNAIFDSSLFVLPHLRKVFANLEERGLYMRGPQRHQQPKLWALSMAVQSEFHRKYVLGAAPVCGEWFIEALRDHASSMQIHSWQQAVNILEQFLFNDELKPHISEWWQEVFSDKI